MPIPIPSQDDAASDIVKVSPPSSDSSHSLSVMDEKPKIEHDEKKDEVDVQGMVDETVRRVREQSDRWVQLPSFENACEIVARIAEGVS